MDNEQQQELRVLGFFGILKQSFKLIFSRKKIFSQISLSFLVPITIILLVKIATAVLFSFNMFGNRDEPEDITVFIIPQYSYLNFNYTVSAKWVVYWLLSEITYLTLLLIFSLLSTIPIVYTIASVYTSEDVTFKKATALIPSIWKRVLTTFFLIFGITFTYDYLLGPVLGVILRLLFFKKFDISKIVAGVILTILYIVAFVYITIIWRLATVVTVMEDDVSGMRAIIKSRNLVQGKMGAVVAVFVVLLTFSAGVDTAFMLLVVYGGNLLSRVIVGIVCFVLKLLVILVLYVVQTVVYFVCKSYHNENVADQKAVDFKSGKVLSV